MTKIYPILVSMLVFVSCNNSAHYAVLEQADSLMNKNLDSAYTLIKSLNHKDLSRKNNAYYSLLLTTAQYKKVMPIENDSVIDIAVQYYTDHFDQDKLTKALMYKGAVLADLNFNKLALENYKEAEKIADTTDYLTMGLLNTRLGTLYQSSYIKNEEHIKRYKKSLSYFHKANHRVFENTARSVIGQLYSTRNFDSAYVYLSQALKTAEKLRDKQQIAHCSFALSKFYNYHNRNIIAAKNLALSVYNNSDSIRVGNDIYSHLSNLYVKLDIIDSARYFAKHISEPYSSIDSMRYHMMQEELALAKNDYKAAYHSQKTSKKLAEIIVKQGKSEEYYAIDKEFDNQVLLTHKAQLETANNLKTFFISLSIIGLTLIIVFWWFYARRKKQALVEKEQFIDSLQSNLQYALDANIKQFEQGKETEIKLKSILEKRISIVKSLLNIKHQYGSMPDVFFNKFNEILSVNQKSQEDCEDIITLANSLYYDVISHIQKEHPDITFKQKLLLSLVCLKFSPIEMLVFLDLNSMTAVYNLRSRLMKKVGAKSLEEYVNEQILSFNQGS